MCGIVGYLNFDRNQPVDPVVLRRMTSALAHRGPDDAGTWVNSSVGLGHRRLSIIDLSRAGRGPMETADGALVVTFNGAIYNYRELRAELEQRGHRFRTKTDTEVILHGYREWGTEVLKRFNGMFAFALWDDKNRTLFVARDRFGVKPLVYYQGDKHFVCASELKALISDPSIPRILDPVGLNHYLSLMSVPCPFTIYKKIRKLNPGHYLLVKEGRVIETRWWDLQWVEHKPKSEEDVRHDIRDLLTDSVNLRLLSDAPLGAFLSGGVDSSVVCALASRCSTSLRTFSISFQGHPDHDESRYSRMVSRHIGSSHSEFDVQSDFLELLPEVVNLYDEPFSTPSSLAIYLMARETSAHAKVVLTGDGADEVFGGYDYRHAILDERFDKVKQIPLSGLRRLNKRTPAPPISWQIPNWLRRAYQLGVAFTTPDARLRVWRYLHMLLYLNEREKFTLYTPEWAEHLRAQSDYLPTYDYLLQFLPKAAPTRLARWLAFDLSTQLEYEMLAKVDKATMAWGLEARNPFLDYRLVQYVVSLPANLMACGSEAKLPLKKIGEEFVPHDVLYRPKQGFCVPIDVWFRGKLPPILQDAFGDDAIGNHILCPQVVSQIIERHRKDRGVDFSYAIFALAWFQMWLSMNKEVVG